MRVTHVVCPALFFRHSLLVVQRQLQLHLDRGRKYTHECREMRSAASAPRRGRATQHQAAAILPNSSQVCYNTCYNKTLPASLACRLVAIRGFLCLILQHLADAPQSVAALSGSISEASCSQVRQCSSSILSRAASGGSSQCGARWYETSCCWCETALLYTAMAKRHCSPPGPCCNSTNIAKFSSKQRSDGASPLRTLDGLSNQTVWRLAELIHT